MQKLGLFYKIDSKCTLWVLRNASLGPDGYYNETSDSSYNSHAKLKLISYNTLS